MLIQDSKTEKLASENLQEGQKHQQHDEFDPDQQHVEFNPDQQHDEFDPDQRHEYLTSAIKEQDKLNQSQLDQIFIKRLKLLCLKYNCAVLRNKSIPCDVDTKRLKGSDRLCKVQGVPRNMTVDK